MKLGTMIQAVDLRKSFGSLTAVDGVHFEVRKGETFGLLGPNGAGKSTTINMLVGAIVPDAGTITFEGGIPAGTKESKNLVGVAPQALALYDDLSAEENLAFFGAMYGLGGAAVGKRVDHCLALAQLQDRRKDRAGTFSGGMKRRLNIAVALMHEPQIVLFDEPTAGVDPQSRNHIFEAIEALKRQGVTILYTTHYMEEAERLCDRVAIMDHGKILAVDTVEGLIRGHGDRAKIVAELSEPVSSLDGIEGELEGNVLTITTDEPMKELAKIAGMNLPLSTLNLERSDLETVFLNLTGRTLRD